jgi:hypothetical protein
MSAGRDAVPGTVGGVPGASALGGSGSPLRGSRYQLEIRMNRFRLLAVSRPRH